MSTKNVGLTLQQFKKLPLGQRERIIDAANKAKSERKPAATVVPITLSDNSVSYNVILTVEGETVVFAAVARSHAETLAREINECACIERAA